MTPEEALKAIKTLTDSVNESTSQRDLWLTVKSVRDVARKVLAEVPSGRGGR